MEAAQSGDRTLVRVAMPAFKVETATDLLAKLDRMGAGAVFDSPDLSGIAGHPGDLRVSAVVHQAKISVDEHGTEAAAATAVIAFAGAAPGPSKPTPEPETFTVNRAFLFCVHDTETLTPLFIGRVSDPTL